MNGASMLGPSSLYDHGLLFIQTALINTIQRLLWWSERRKKNHVVYAAVQRRDRLPFDETKDGDKTANAQEVCTTATTISMKRNKFEEWEQDQPQGVSSDDRVQHSSRVRLGQGALLDTMMTLALKASTTSELFAMNSN